MAALQKDIALGLRYDLVRFAALKDASIFLKWQEDGLTSTSVAADFESAFFEAVERAKAIHFNLNGILDLANAFHDGSGECRLDSYTNWEFHQLVTLAATNRTVAEKLRFYRADRIMDFVEIVASIERPGAR